MTQLICELKCCLASISFLLSVILNRSQIALHITGLWLPVHGKNSMTLKKVKTFRRCVPMNFMEPKNCFPWHFEILGLANNKTNDSSNLIFHISGSWQCTDGSHGKV